ncbi:MAG: hypothetical protein ABIL06_26635 [Pseudomonadota bacterium]
MTENDPQITQITRINGREKAQKSQKVWRQRKIMAARRRKRHKDKEGIGKRI